MRNRKKLEEKVVEAKNKETKALSYYNLGLFHDNNAREKEAIPNYLNALRLGLNRETKAKCLVWLASSLYKTGRQKAALRRCKEAMKITRNKKLLKFLRGLEKRINNSLR